MDENAIREWFAGYLDTLAARGRGEADDLDAFLEYYGVPLVVATDDAADAMTAADDVIGFARRQVEGMRATSYDHSTTIDAEVTTLNATSALYRAHFARERANGSEIGRLRVTYLIIDGSTGLQISAMAVSGG
jgi:hypothetical protein